jgi:phosphoribosylformimino-5-aminoimidazole carboxamide ribonucleotide (ProFAR) isomerase
MALHRADEPRVVSSGTVIATDTHMATETERRVPAPTIISYDLNKVMEAARGWQEKAATASDAAASEAYRRSAAQFERLVMRSLDTPAIC